MMEATKERIEELLRGVIHPESGANIVDGGFVDNITADGSRITVSLRFKKTRDPFAAKLKNQTQSLLEEHYPELKGSITVFVKGAAPARPVEEVRRTTTGDISHIVAVASGKGGVGKSTVAANLALTLRNMGYSVGLLDADIYGPSQPKMFGCEGAVPEAERIDGYDYIVPIEVKGIKLMSIGFFIRPTDALLWRGAMATNALKQLIHQTLWGKLDFLLIDLPPGTGDVHLSIISELKVNGAVIVSTPQQVAVADVVRGVEMFRHENVNIPVLGIIENMSWFTPAELPDHRYYIFGHGGAAAYARQCDAPFLGEIPIVQSIMEGGESGVPAVESDGAVNDFYRHVAEKIVDKLQ